MTFTNAVSTDLPPNCDIFVGIPIYNASGHLTNLLNDLQRYVEEGDAAHFLLSDDSSTDSRVKEILQSHPFVKRKNVSVQFAAANGGFVVNVNSILAKRPANAHFIILNTDTRIFNCFLNYFRKMEKRFKGVASITPLTNCGTIASVFDWPNGNVVDENFISKVAETINSELSLIEFIEVPTGVGFCMLMTAEALDVLGGFDLAFQRGYGEESDWCRRAAALGFKNLLGLGLFVAHIGTQSFVEHEKAAALLHAKMTLDLRYPDYFVEVGKFMRDNTLRFFRLNLLLKTLGSQKIIFQMLHSSPDGINPGGTELHVRLTSEKYIAAGRAVLEIFPVDKHSFDVNLFNEQGRLSTERFAFSDFPRVISLVLPRLDFIHIHHFYHWDQQVIDYLISRTDLRKVFTAHDFWMICPSINLVKFGKIYCDVEEDMKECNRCYSVYHRFKGPGVQAHRSNLEPLLLAAEKVIVPSVNTGKVFTKAFPNLANKLEVVPHDLSYVPFVDSVEDFPRREPVIAFVGAMGIHKGVRLLADSMPLLKQAGYKIVIVGIVPPQFISVFGDENIFPYKGVDGLKDMLAEVHPDLICFISAWAETFCYTLFESLITYGAAVPVVGPYGNPRDFVSTSLTGTVMSEYTPEALVHACMDALSNKSVYLARVADWRKNYEKGPSPQEKTLFNQLLNSSVAPSDYNFASEPLFSTDEFSSVVTYEGAVVAAARAFRTFVKRLPFFGGFARTVFWKMRELRFGGE